MPRKIAVVNQKGGVGKTTTAVNLAVALAGMNKRVLLIDYDPQANATQFLGLADVAQEASASPSTWGSAQFTLGKGAFAPQRDVVAKGLDVVPATDELAYLEQDLLTDVMTGPRRLAGALRQVEGQYDFVLADCAPTVGLLAINAMVACPEILIPVKLAPASVPGALGLRTHLDALKEKVEEDIRVLGVLGTFMNETAKKPKEILALLKDIFADLVFSTVINTSQAVENAAEGGRPVLLADTGSRGAAQYYSLMMEVMNRGNRI